MLENKPDWNDAPGWAKWLAADVEYNVFDEGYLKWHWFAEMPGYDTVHRCWSTEEDADKLTLSAWQDDIVSQSLRSLEARPEPFRIYSFMGQ